MTKRIEDDVDISYDVNSKQNIWNLWQESQLPQVSKSKKRTKQSMTLGIERLAFFNTDTKSRSALVRELYEHMMVERPVLYNAQDATEIFPSVNDAEDKLEQAPSGTEGVVLRQDNENHHGNTN